MEFITADSIKKEYTTETTDLVIDHQKREKRTRTVLENLSIKIPTGGITAILGRSGCGKSTFLKLLAGQELPDEGSISLPDGWHSALLSPNPYVITWTNVIKNISMAAGAGRNPEERMELAWKMAKLVHLEEYADLTPVELSTGMRQRLGLARVLASQCQLLLMDEPFASLDFITRAEMQEELLTIQKEIPRTIILVTHQLEEALLLADRIYVLHPWNATSHLSSIDYFDLSDLKGPRDLSSNRFITLGKQIAESCRQL